jgi:hypothetical protein
MESSTTPNILNVSPLSLVVPASESSPLPLNTDQLRKEALKSLVKVHDRVPKETRDEELVNHVAEAILVGLVDSVLSDVYMLGKSRKNN